MNFLVLNQPNSHPNIFFLCFDCPSGPRPPQFWSFENTLRRTILGRTPVDERSARRRDLYLTKHTFHKKHTFMPPTSGIRTRIPASERPHMVLLKIIFPLSKQSFYENYPQFEHKPPKIPPAPS